MNIYPGIAGAVDAWEGIVFGHLKWNRYFGESADKPPRGDPSTCSSVLIIGKQKDGSIYRLLVDPTLRRSREEYDFDVNRRTGLHLSDITHCFSTHHHADHHDGLAYFPDAKWLTAAANIPLIAASAPSVGARLIAVEGEFLPGVFALPLPGHTKDLHGVAFSCEGRRVAVVGDAVMTKGHFRNRTTEFQSDPDYVKIAGQTIENLDESFDIVVPGHDNLILTRRGRHGYA